MSLLPYASAVLFAAAVVVGVWEWRRRLEGKRRARDLTAAAFRDCEIEFDMLHAQRAVTRIAARRILNVGTAGVRNLAGR